MSADPQPPPKRKGRCPGCGRTRTLIARTGHLPWHQITLPSGAKSPCPGSGKRPAP